VICDTAHNKEGLGLVMEQLRKESFQTLHIVLGMVNDKDLSSILFLFPKTARYYFCKPNIPRGLDAEELKGEALKFGLTGAVYTSVDAAYNHALNNAMPEDLIYAGGSTFVVAELPI
jgi:dihydrofolate synthase/folylpolyglutamate synthase